MASETIFDEHYALFYFFFKNYLCKRSWVSFLIPTMPEVV